MDADVGHVGMSRGVDKEVALVEHEVSLVM